MGAGGPALRLLVSPEPLPLRGQWGRSAVNGGQGTPLRGRGREGPGGSWREGQCVGNAVSGVRGGHRGGRGAQRRWAREEEEDAEGGAGCAARGGLCHPPRGVRQAGPGAGAAAGGGASCRMCQYPGGDVRGWVAAVRGALRGGGVRSCVDASGVCWRLRKERIEGKGHSGNAGRWMKGEVCWRRSGRADARGELCRRLARLEAA